MDENEKTLKIDFPPQRTDRKQQKLHFRRSGRVENSKNSVSAVAEKRKTAKTTFRPWPKA